MTTVEGAKLCMGVWLPECEQHFVEMMTSNKKNHRVVDGFGTYQYRKIERAMLHIPADRRRVCLDIGSHVGMWAMWLTREFAKVECFEPVPRHASIMPHNMASVGRDNYTIHHCALGETAGTARITLKDRNTGASHVDSKSTDGDVEVRTLDSFGFTDVDFIKIDVEGFELQVVKGAEQTLRNNKPFMVVEQKGNDVNNFKQARNSALDWLRSIGAVPKFEMGGDWFVGWA